MESLVVLSELGSVGAREGWLLAGWKWEKDREGMIGKWVVGDPEESWSMRSEHWTEDGGEGDVGCSPFSCSASMMRGKEEGNGVCFRGIARL